MDNDRFARRERPWLLYLLCGALFFGGLSGLALGQTTWALFCLPFALLFACVSYLFSLHRDFDPTLEQDRMEHIALRTSIRVPKLKEPRPASPPALPDERAQKPEAPA